MRFLEIVATMMMNQKSVIFSMANGYQIPAEQRTPITPVDGLKVIKIVSEMVGRTPGIFTGGGVPKLVNCLLLMPRNFLK